MAALLQALTALDQISETEKQKVLKLLSKIFANILNNPSEEKYSKINLQKLQEKFVSCPPCICILFAAGFEETHDRTQIKWTHNNDTIKLLETVKNITKYYFHPDYKQIISQLIEFEFEIYDIIKAIDNTPNNKNIQQILEYITAQQEQQMISDVTFTNQQTLTAETNTNVSICANSHILIVYNKEELIKDHPAYINGFICNQCSNHYLVYDVCYHCGICQYDLCKLCHERPTITHNELNQLLGLGFDKELSLLALEMSCNNVDAAANLLFDPAFFEHVIDEQNHENDVVEGCRNTIDTCNSFHQFLSVIMDPDQFNSLQLSSVQISNIIDDYCHLTSKHNTDKEFEFIVVSLGECNITKCNAFGRILRSKDEQKNCEAVQINSRDIAALEIFDKMHCYFSHCFDIGNRLSRQEKLSIQSDDDIIVNINCIRKLKLKDINKRLRKRFINSNKYNQLMLNTQEQKTVSDDFKCNNDNMFQAGYMFNYYATEKDIHADQHRIPNTIPILPIHTCLKDEMRQNQICVVTAEQFNNEYTKAKLHFNCRYRKIEHEKMKLEWLLAVMFYCNYTELQYQFSKTYRENKGKQHCNFYWMGKYMQSVVYESSSNSMIIPSFYHGVGDELIVALSGQRHFYGIYVFCPLSTTPVLEVALNFTNNNKGMIIEFSDTEREDFNNDWSKKCLSCSWISDFGNEREYLFVQSQSYVFTVKNIMHAKTGMNYSSIMQALTMIDQLMMRPAIAKRMSQELSQGMKLLMTELIKCQLSQTMIEFEQKTSIIDKYSKKLCKAHFERVKTIEMSWKIQGFVDDFIIFEKFYYVNRGININNIVALYSNLEHIEAGYNDADLNEKMMKQLYIDWLSVSTKTLTRINISLNQSITTYKLIQFVDKNAIEYRKMGLNVTGFIHPTLDETNQAIHATDIEISTRNDLCDLVWQLLNLGNGAMYLSHGDSGIDLTTLNKILPYWKENNMNSIWIKVIGTKTLLFVTENEVDANIWYETIRKSWASDEDQVGLKCIHKPALRNNL
eukprot:422647_1